MLYRILRGSGLTGLSGILPVTSEGVVRPLLEIDRLEIEAWLRERGIAWREDETNQDRTYRPQSPAPRDPAVAARQLSIRQLDAALANLATLARDEEAYWDSQLANPQSLSPTPNPWLSPSHSSLALPRWPADGSVKPSPWRRAISVPSISPTWSECSKWRDQTTGTIGSRRPAWTSADPST